jgi:O-acetyl-ADP-ribose deacetylase (regulator of RNase III)
VNVVGKDLNLNHGAITSAILRAAGSGIEKECQTNAPNGVGYGDIVSTSGGNITCKAIYHGAVPEWSSGNGETVCKQQTFAEYSTITDWSSA